MGSGVPTEPRGGSHRDRGSNIPAPRYHLYCITHTDSYKRAWALSEPTLIQAAKGDLHPREQSSSVTPDPYERGVQENKYMNFRPFLLYEQKLTLTFTGAFGEL